MAKTLAGHVALVTGGSRGIGRATCLRLAREGAAIAVNFNRQEAAAEEVVAEIAEAGGRAVAVSADVSRQKRVEKMVEEVGSLLGPVDVLINNAGILRFGQLLDYRDEDFDAMWQVNVKGVVHCSAAVAPAMIEKGWGRIVNVASNAGIGTALPGTTFYAATKAAVLNLTRRLAFELGKHGITVNALLPGYTKTDMTVAGRSQEEIEATRKVLDGRSMIGRGIAEPEEIAHGIAFLAGEESGFITGQLLMADGGRTDYLSHV